MNRFFLDNTVASGLEVEEEVPSFEFAPAMTVHKFKTLQNRRVPVVIKCECLLVEHAERE